MSSLKHKRGVASRAVAGVIAGLLAGAAFFLVQRRAVMAERTQFRSMVRAMAAEAAARHGLPPLLIESVIRRESGYRAEAVGRAGEIGLMQITMPVARDWARAMNRPCPDRGMLFDPRLNIEIGSWYLAQAVRRWKETDDSYVLALAQYNAGPARVREWRRSDRKAPPLKSIRFSSTRRYISSVLEWYSEQVRERDGSKPEKHRSGSVADPAAGRKSEGRFAGDGADPETRPAG